MRRYEKAAGLLGQWMCERAVSTMQLSRQTGIDRGTIRKILAGRQAAISTRNMVALAQFFSVSVAELMDKLS